MRTPWGAADEINAESRVRRASNAGPARSLMIIPRRSDVRCTAWSNSRQAVSAARPSSWTGQDRALTKRH